jgi:hypothetical protein
MLVTEPPRTRDYSGATIQVNVPVPRDLHRTVKTYAIAHKRRFRDVVREALERYVAEHSY